MKKYWFVGWLTVLSGLLVACKSTEQQQHAMPDFSTGPISAEVLLSEHPLFADSYAAFTPDLADVRSMQALTGKKLKVIFGLWCDDSQREVSHLLKLLQASGVELAELQLYTLDGYKKDPQGVAEQHNIEFVPTIILFDGNKEMGRVVERPKLSLARDLAAIAMQGKVSKVVM